MYSRPRRSSSVIGGHTLVCPVIAHESFFHVSLPNSPGCGIVWNDQAILPVCASYARTSPGGSLRYINRSPTPLPTMTRFLYTTGGDVLAKCFLLMVQMRPSPMSTM